MKPLSNLNKKELLRLQDKYKSDQEIGNVFGVTRQAIQLKRKKYGIKKNFITDKNIDRNKEICRLRKEGQAIVYLCWNFELSSQRVYAIIKNGRK